MIAPAFRDIAASRVDAATPPTAMIATIMLPPEAGAIGGPVVGLVVGPAARRMRGHCGKAKDEDIISVGKIRDDVV